MTKRAINWEATTAIGQLLSAVVVAVTLFYLTAQVHYAKVAASDANRLVRSNGVVNFFLSAMHNPEFRSTGLQFQRDNWLMEEIARRMEVSEEAASQLQSSANYWFWLHWGQWSTTMEERDRSELKGMIGRFYTLPHIRLIWEAQRGGMDASFTEFVDATIAEVDAGQAEGRSEVDRETLTARLDALGIGVPLGPSAPDAAGSDSGR